MLLQLRHAVGPHRATSTPSVRRDADRDGWGANVELALNRLAGQSQDVTAQASGIADSVVWIDGPLLL